MVRLHQFFCTLHSVDPHLILAFVFVFGVSRTFMAMRLAKQEALMSTTSSTWFHLWFSTSMGRLYNSESAWYNSIKTRS